MVKKTGEGKTRKSKTAGKARASSTKRPKRETQAAETDAVDEAEDEDIEVEIEVDLDPEDCFGRDGMFGKDGPFEPKGPFGPGGPFGPAGIFGPQGLFGQGGGRHRHRRRHREHGGPGAGRRRGRMFSAGELRLVLLALISEEPRHGYDCIKALEEATGGAYAPSPGVVYPTLQMLLDEGLIAEQESDDSRKVYEATDDGHQVLQDSAEEIEELLERLGRRAKKASAARSSDMMRAMGNLASVLTNAATQGKLSGKNKDNIVDLIDELARKIERL